MRITNISTRWIQEAAKNLAVSPRPQVGKKSFLRTKDLATPNSHYMEETKLKIQNWSRIAETTMEMFPTQHSHKQRKSEDEFTSRNYRPYKEMNHYAGESEEARMEEVTLQETDIIESNRRQEQENVLKNEISEMKQSADELNNKLDIAEELVD